MKIEKLTVEELHEFAMVGTRWRLRVGSQIQIERNGQSPIVLTRAQIGIVVNLDDDHNFATVVFMGVGGEPLATLEGCIDRFLVPVFEPVDVESCRSQAVAMGFFWDSECGGQSE